MSTTSSISGAIKWTGLASNTDFASVVDQLVAIEQRTITKQETWQSQWQEKLTAINTLDTRLVALKLGAQSYDSRDKLLSRKGTSSDETVATINNTSTAATGVYSVTVGNSIQEIIASKTYKDGQAIGGGSPAMNAAGHYLDANGKVVGTTEPADENVLKAVAGKLGLSGVTYNAATKEYVEEGANVIVARLDDSGTGPADWKIVEYNGLADGEDIAVISSDNNKSGRLELVLADDGTTIGAATVATADIYYTPLAIEMGGQTLTLAYDPTGTADETSVGLYHENMNMETLAKVINNTVDSDPTGMPAVKAAILYDKTRSGETYSRLTISGLEGGLKNHITVSDPTDLCLDRNSVDDPITNSWVGSQPQPLVSSASNYTGHVNKSITVVATNFSGKGVLGTDTIEFSWADTCGNSGKFTISSADWDQTNNCLKEDVEILQGVKINFDGSGGTNIIKNEAFTIDCQAPVMQKAADIGLSQTDKWVHQGVADLTSPVNKGSGGIFAYSYAGREYSLKITAEVGLSGLAELINNDSSNPGITASVLNDGMGTATSYKLVLSGNQAGAEYGIHILDSTSLSNMPTGPETWDHAREASNSMCRIDGYPNDGTTWIQRIGNEVGDVIDGVVVTLQGSGTTQITVQNDVSGMTTKIKELVEAVNYAKTYIKEQTKYGGGKLVSKVLKDGSFSRETEGGDASGVMIGNYGFQISQSEIDGLMTKAIFTCAEYIAAVDPGGAKESLLSQPEQKALYDKYLEDNGLIYMRLSDIGIVSDPDNNGLYKIEESVLREALTKNPEAVIKLFTFTSDDSMGTYKKYEDEDARPALAGWAVNMGYKMSDLTRSDDVIDSSTGNVLQPAKGITKVLAANYTNIISGIDDKIAREEKRISIYRDRLEAKFARLETLLSQLNNQSESLSAQLSQLESSSS